MKRLISNPQLLEKILKMKNQMLAEGVTAPIAILLKQLEPPEPIGEILGMKVYVNPYLKDDDVYIAEESEVIRVCSKASS